jgi:hypothetical protein
MYGRNRVGKGLPKKDKYITRKSEQNKELQRKYRSNRRAKISDNSTNSKKYTVFLYNSFVDYTDNHITGTTYYRYEFIKSFDTIEEAELNFVQIFSEIFIKCWKTYICVRYPYTTGYDSETCVGIVTNQTIDHSFLTANIIRKLNNGVAMWKIGSDDIEYMLFANRYKPKDTTTCYCFGRSKYNKAMEKHYDNTIKFAKTPRTCIFDLHQTDKTISSTLNKFMRGKFKIFRKILKLTEEEKKLEKLQNPGLEKRYNVKYVWHDKSKERIDRYIEILESNINSAEDSSDYSSEDSSDYSSEDSSY